MSWFVRFFFKNFLYNIFIEKYVCYDQPVHIYQTLQILVHEAEKL
jgi:hypothetical protein